MTVIALCGLGITAILALFGAGVAWGTSKTIAVSTAKEIEKLEKRIEKLEASGAGPALDVLRTEFKLLREHFDDKFDDMNRRIDAIESKR